MDTDRALVSGEGVRLVLDRAGVGSRTIAAAVDVLIQALALIVLVLVDVAIVGSADDAATAAVVLVEVVLVLAGYPIVAEWTSKGRTLGKASMGLRVVRDDGGPIGFRQALVRGLAGLVLEKPGLLFPLTTIAGVFTIALSDSEKRIGDMMAGTVVLNERAGDQTLGVPPWWVAPPLQAWAMSVDLHRLDDALALRVRQFVSRAHSLTVPAQLTLGEELRAHVLAVVAPPPPADAPTPFVLSALLVERRRRAELAAAPVPYAPSHLPPTVPGPFAPVPTSTGGSSPFAPPR
ncbi:RDD family protein [uncultured Jatrophihabitans sp.]|uniref:RDD family protein n=1 Tax=uncultured Jatrophihabitans sp. TaxID=1610747 RepID=UPI0035CAA764